MFNAPSDPGKIWDYFALSYLIIFLSFMVISLVFLKNRSVPKIIKEIIIVFFPTQAVLIYALDQLICQKASSLFCYNINHFVPLSIIAFFLLMAFTIIHWKARKKEGVFKIKNYFSVFGKIFDKKNRAEIILVLTVVILNFGFGLYHLAKFSAVDEALWTFDRIPKFWENLKDWEWYKTNVSDKPGITVALLSGAGLNFVNPEDYESTRFKSQINPPEKNVEEMNFFMRLPILFFSSLSLFLLYFFIRKLLGKETSLIAIIFIGLSPILLGISRIINPDALLWIFSSCVLLSFIIYQRDRKDRYLYLSGLFLGFSLLTKYVANIFYVFFLALLFLEYLFNCQKYKSISWKDYLKKNLADYVVLVFFSLLVFFLFLPAAWIEPSLVLKGTIFSQAFQKVYLLFSAIMIFLFFDLSALKGKISSFLIATLIKKRKHLLCSFLLFFVLSIAFVLANTYLGMKWYDFESILASPKTSYRETGFFGLFFSSFYSLIFGISPIAFLSIIFLIIFVIKKTLRKNDFSPHSVLTFYFVLFILLYYFASTINLVGATIRYQVIIFPIGFILAAIGIHHFLNYLGYRKTRTGEFDQGTYLARGKYIFLYSLLIIFSLFSLFSIKPFYFSYASDLLPKKYVLNLKDMGDGSFEAAQYLNNLPNAKNLGVWTDKKGVCSFFKGRCYIGVEFTHEDNVQFDYFVVSSGRENRTTGMNLNHLNAGLTSLKIYPLYDSPDWDFNIEIGGRPNNFIKIFSVSKVEFIQKL
ncbi:MAG TPA: glycosyltransferase family 39 protein [Candidatus Moranbacteria bacterium]|nr:glycosyltransferase family 39 protein [Candidatus Moranbacteria bacterium]